MWYPADEILSVELRDAPGHPDYKLRVFCLEMLETPKAAEGLLVGFFPYGACVYNYYVGLFGVFGDTGAEGVLYPVRVVLVHLATVGLKVKGVGFHNNWKS